MIEKLKYEELVELKGKIIVGENIEGEIAADEQVVSIISKINEIIEKMNVDKTKFS